MADLKRIFISHTTGDHSDAGTDAGFKLIAQNTGGSLTVDFPSLPHDERERRRSDEYVFDVAGKGLTTDVKLKIKMVSSSDGWLPKTIWAIGETTANEFVVLAANPNWDEWFDRGADAAGPDQHSIN